MIKPDWQYVKNPLLLLVVSLVISSVIYMYSDWHSEIVHERYERIEKSHAAARRKSVEADRDRELYERYLENFTHYSEQGYIGEEQRLNWIEQLQLIDSSLGIIAMHYDISPQTDVVPLGITVKSRKITIQQSKMKLKVDLVHEGDFFKMLSSLRAQAKGFYVLSSCELSSKIKKNIPRFDPNVGNLAAECELDWYTVNVKG